MTWYAGNGLQTERFVSTAWEDSTMGDLHPVVAGADAPTETPTEAPEKTETDDLDEEIKRIIREVPDPTPQPGGE